MNIQALVAKKAFLALTILAATVCPIKAAVIFSEDFNSYPDGGIVTNSSGLWTLNSGTAGTMLVNNQTLELVENSSTRSEDIYTTLPGGPYTNGHPTVTALYTRFTVNFSSLPGNPGTYFAHFIGESVSSAFRQRIWATTTNAHDGTIAPDGFFYLGVGNNRPATANPFGPANGELTDLFTTNVTYTIVTRYVITNATSTIWLNPNAETDPGATADDFDSPTNKITYFGFRQSNNSGGVMHLDDFKISTQFADIAGPNTAPTITGIPDQAIPANGNTGPLDFMVEDAESPASSLVVTASSSNTGLIPNNPANLTLGSSGNGTNRTITVTPAGGQQGSSTITVNVSDSVHTSFTTFTVTVGAPSVSDIPNQRTYTNEPVPTISFTVSDAEGDTLSLSSDSSNTNLLTTNNIVFGSSGGNRTITLTPEPGQVGVTTVSVNVSDGHTTTSSSFKLTVSPYLGLVFADDFNYTNFPVSPNALYQAEGSPWNSSSGSSYEVQVTNGLAYLSYTNTEDVAAPLTNAPYFPSNAVIFYTKFSVNFSFLPSSAGNYFLHFSSSTNDTLNFRCRVFAQTNGAADGSFRLALSINSAAASAQFPLDLELNTTYTVVTRYNSATSESTLWINPASESDTSVSATDLLNTSSVGAISLRETTGIGNLAIGSLRVGTKFTDVITPSAPIPETLQVTRIGGNIVLSWNNPAFFLATAPTLNGTFNKINGATSPYTNAISGSQSYFRLTYP